MSKKKKKNSSESKPFFSKKKKRLLIKLIIFSVLGTISYALYNPNIIKDPVNRQKVLDARETVSQLNQNGQQKLTELIPQAKKLTGEDGLLSQKGLVLGDKEIFIDDLVKDVTKSLETLPSTQLTNFKADFCADVINLAVKQATASASH